MEFKTTFKAIDTTVIFYKLLAIDHMRYYVQAGPWADMLKEPAIKCRPRPNKNLKRFIRAMTDHLFFTNPNLGRPWS